MDRPSPSGPTAAEAVGYTSAALVCVGAAAGLVRTLLNTILYNIMFFVKCDNGSTRSAVLSTMFVFRFIALWDALQSFLRFSLGIHSKEAR